MKFTYKFEKILSLREREKDEAAIQLENAVRNFEEVAQKLYDLLKRKETIEEDLIEKIHTGVTVQDIRLQRQFVVNLQKDIDYQQQLVIKARQRMQYEEQRLTDKNIEVKKFEKIREKDRVKFIQLLNEEEDKNIDEIAMQVVARGK